VASSPSRLAPDAIAERLRAQFGEDITDYRDSFGHAQVSVVPARYRELVGFVRDEPSIACDFLDFVTAVDRKDQGFEVVTQMTSSATGASVRIKTPCTGEEPSCPTISDLFAGASWHEREASELFGIDFEGHPHLVKLLLPEQFEGYPLRKSFELISRVAKPWPGESEIPD
jgi:NADH:ubiquinone oxidoreductase subunit C